MQALQWPAFHWLRNTALRNEVNVCLWEKEKLNWTWFEVLWMAIIEIALATIDWMQKNFWKVIWTWANSSCFFLVNWKKRNSLRLKLDELMKLELVWEAQTFLSAVKMQTTSLKYCFYFATYKQAKPYRTIYKFKNKFWIQEKFLIGYKFLYENDATQPNSNNVYHLSRIVLACQ